MSEYVDTDKAAIFDMWLRSQSQPVRDAIQGMTQELVGLLAKLAATEVRLEAALTACQKLVDWQAECTDQSIWTPERRAAAPPPIDLSDVLDLADEAIAMSPANAASVIEERDRLRVVIETFADRDNWTTFGDPREDGSDVWQWDGPDEDPGEFARQALATKGATE